MTFGIINQIVSSAELLPTCLQIATDIAHNAPLAVQAIKAVLNKHPDFDQQYDSEIEAYNKLIDTADRLEGIEAFNESREPIFTGH